jgi:hypothetical protein
MQEQEAPADSNWLRTSPAPIRVIVCSSAGHEPIKLVA